MKCLLPARYRVQAARAASYLQNARLQRPYVWETLSDPSLCGAAGQYAEARAEIIGLIHKAPRRVIDLGCGNGATAAAAKGAFPSAHVIGVEQNPAAAQLAAARLDRIIVASLDTIDYDALGIAERSIDAALLLDVLEHLYDPWDVLRRLRTRLTSNGQVVASIPNARNYWLLSHLLDGGEFSYGPNGLLDITHIRFFTRREIEKMFAETGYRITKMMSNFDERVPEGLPAIDGSRNGQKKFVLQNLTNDDVKELRTLQFYVAASPIQ